MRDLANANRPLTKSPTRHLQQPRTERTGADRKIRSVSDGCERDDEPTEPRTERTSADSKIRSVSDGSRAGVGPREEVSNADAEEGEIPQATARAHGRQGLAWIGRVVRRLRSESARAVLADRPPDRGGPRRHDALHRARRQDLGARLP